MVWDDILKEVMQRKAKGQRINLLSEEDQNNSYAETKALKLSKRRSLAVYGLGAKYGSLYFTKREAECMVLLLRGKTINSVATKLNLSPRTVEYYVKNMKIKVGCRTKFELIDLIYASEFMKNIDF